VRTASGEVILCESLISTAGVPETKKLFPTSDTAATFSKSDEDQISGRLSFIESISLLDKSACENLPKDRTIIFFNLSEKFSYHRPDDAVDLNSGVICFPGNFQGNKEEDTVQLRVTHIANYDK
jgi:hypothetical protein